MDTSESLLRFVTAGNVNDGKSTLIGRLLIDSGSIKADQLASVTKASLKKGSSIDYSLFTDGLIAERELNITIDVAHRYFSTAKRNFILGDSPGHFQYTQNMVAAASQADAIVAVIDVTQGIQNQTRRHLAIASVLRVPHFIILINKMDRVSYSQTHFESLQNEVRELMRQLNVARFEVVPVSALEGENVVHRSKKLSWFAGPSLLEHLEQVEVGRPAVSLRAIVQLKLGEGYAVSVQSGDLVQNQKIKVLPSQQLAEIASVQALARSSPVIKLKEGISLQRGDLIVDCSDDSLSIYQRPQSTLCWLDSTPLSFDKTYFCLHMTRKISCRVEKVISRLNLDLIRYEPILGSLGGGDIAHVQLVLDAPLVCESYDTNKYTGSYCLVDPDTHFTCAAGMLMDGQPY